MLKLTVITASIAAAGIALAAPALADTDSLVNVGNDQLGYTQGTTGASVAIGGVRTTVDGFGTLHGSTEITSGGRELFSIRQSYDNGFESTTSFLDGIYEHETEVYYPPQLWTESNIKTPNGSASLVCYPTKGCVVS